MNCVCLILIIKCQGSKVGLVISILAALLTPTPDVFNMMLMGGPLYLLYEIGILVLKMMKI